ncbi:MAG: DUF6282 family protein [Vicinamibacterales bacterium]
MSKALAVAAVAAVVLMTDAAAQSDRSLSGVIDVHTHAGPDDVARTIDAIDSAQLARDRGMRAIVLKNHSQPTSALAYLAQQEAPGITVVGGIVLNRSVGGLNAAAVEQMAAIGQGAGSIVWLPTRDAENQVRFDRQDRPFVAVSKDGQLVPAFGDVLQVMAAKNLVLATGHSSAVESLLIIRAAKAAGVRAIVVTHPTTALVNMSIEQMREAAGLGAYLELTYNQLVLGGITSADYARMIRAVGANRIILSSDAGARTQPLHPDAMVQFIRQMRAEGISDSDIDMMTKTNPAALLGLETNVAPMASLTPQGFPPGFPREGSKKVLENNRVIVWDATWPKGTATGLHEHLVDYLSVTVVEGAVKITQRDGTSSVATAQFGGVRFNRKGVIHAEEGVSDQERRAIMVELKTVQSPAEAVVTGSGIPLNGATKGLENERVAVWDVTWTQGQRLPRRQQGRDAVVVFLTGGVIRQSPQGAAVSERRWNAGDVLYVPAGTEVPAEEATQGAPRAVFIEVK